MFISSYHDRRKDIVQVWERNAAGKRILREYDAPYYFYVSDPDGQYEALTGEKLSRLDFDSKHEFEDAIQSFPIRFESDVYPQEKVMMDNYQGKPAPILVVGFIDIEVDYDPKVGFPRSENPYAPISAITLYRSDLKSYITLAIPPRGQDPAPPDDTHFYFTQEREMLSFFFEIIDDVDVLSGWNSEFFDLPYIGKRVEMLFGQSGLKHLGFKEAASPPRWGEHVRFKGSQQMEIILILDSRVHLDYLRLFRKFNLEGRQSHSLAAIADDELHIPKLSFEGNLYDLYRNDFEKFVKYNRRDVEILVELDKKFKYIELANQMVHEATVNFSSVFGSVQLIDTAIMNFCHSQFKKILFDRMNRVNEDETEGALVMDPKSGLIKWLGACDINSLYPSTYRSLNLSPEKIIGQVKVVHNGTVFELAQILNVKIQSDKTFLKLGEEEQQRIKANWVANKQYEAAWKAVNRYVNGDESIADVQLEVTLDSDRHNPIILSIPDLITLLKENKYALSAHGTILDQSSGPGLIPSVLAYWFIGRKEMQAKKKKFGALARKLQAEGRAEVDPEYAEAKTQEEYFDMLQGVRKVLLNSSYGATLNEFCRFFDQRLGSSTTDSGRQITGHMIDTVSKNLMGDNYPQVKKSITFTKPKKGGGNSAPGEAIRGGVANIYEVDNQTGLGPIYSDTDSIYFSMEALVDNVDDAIACADAVADEINASFPEFMRTAFFCQPEFDSLIKTNREIVASTAFFRAKKKYALRVVDKEGVRIPEGHKDELKTMGSDVKLSSTPEAIREFLKTVTLMILRGKPKVEIDEFILDFRLKFKEDELTPEQVEGFIGEETLEEFNILDFATVTSVKELDKYFLPWERIEKKGLGKVNMTAAARAVINHNECLKLYKDNDTQPIIAGQKIKMVWLMPNEHKFTNIAFASEVDVPPDWFYEHFEPDMKATEKKLIDTKLEAIYNPIGWQVPTPQTVAVNKMFEF